MRLISSSLDHAAIFTRRQPLDIIFKDDMRMFEAQCLILFFIIKDSLIKPFIAYYDVWRLFAANKDACLPELHFLM